MPKRSIFILAGLLLLGAVFFMPAYVLPGSGALSFSLLARVSLAGKLISICLIILLELGLFAVLFNQRVLTTIIGAVILAASGIGIASGANVVPNDHGIPEGHLHFSQLGWGWIYAIIVGGCFIAIALLRIKDPREKEPHPLLQSLRKVSFRDFSMYIALFNIVMVFAILTNGNFISSRNMSDLMSQTGFMAVIAVGMTLVIVIRQIDLSVGFLAGFLGAIAAIAMTQWGMPVWAALPMVLLFGIAAGIITGFLVAKLGIPSFVATLAGMLIYRGFLLMVTMKTGTIIIPDKFFIALGNGFVPDLPWFGSILPGVHKLTLILGVIAIAFFIASEIKSRSSRIKYNFEVPPMPLFVIKLIFITAVLGYIIKLISGYNGMSWCLVILLAVVAIYHFITTKTVLGRHIYAVGGNPEAAELSGISVKKITYIVFGSIGFLSALGGILFASRLQSATTKAGELFELDAIASAYIGGVSAAGGVGKIIGTLVGAIVYMSLTSGMNLLGTDQALQYVLRGAILIVAVLFDVMTRRKRA